VLVHDQKPKRPVRRGPSLCDLPVDVCDGVAGVAVGVDLPEGVTDAAEQVAGHPHLGVLEHFLEQRRQFRRALLAVLRKRRSAQKACSPVGPRPRLCAVM
jgi:hypothetical protein